MESVFSNVLFCLVLLVLCGLMLYCLLSKKVIYIENGDSRNSSKNVFPFLFAGVALVISLVALAVVLPKTSKTLDLDYYDVIVAILSLLVTILLGWQIYNGIRFVEQVEKVDKAVDVAQKAQREIATADQKVKESASRAGKCAEETKALASEMAKSVSLVRQALDIIKEYQKKIDAQSQEAKNAALSAKQALDSMGMIVAKEQTGAHRLDEFIKRANAAIDQVQESIERIDQFLDGKEPPEDNN